MFSVSTYYNKGRELIKKISGLQEILKNNYFRHPQLILRIITHKRTKSDSFSGALFRKLTVAPSSLFSKLITKPTKPIIVHVL
jgi:hypothetical protein